MISPVLYLIVGRCERAYPVYEKFYGLKENPFQLTPNPSYLYLSEKHQDALTYLEYGLIQKSGFLLLTGEIGSGKTILVRHFLKEYCRKLTTAVITNTNVTADQLLSLVLIKFDIPFETMDKAVHLEKLERFLTKKYSRKNRALLIVDEAQNLSDEALEELRMLSNLQKEDDMLLQIFLVGQPDLRLRLKNRRLEQLAQRIAASYHLKRLTRQETAAYIAFRVKKARGRPDLFTDEAVLAVYKLSKGIPRMINLLSDAALVYGFAEGRDRIALSDVKQAARDKGGLGMQFNEPAPDPPPDEPAPADDDTADRIQHLEENLKKISAWAVRMQRAQKNK